MEGRKRKAPSQNNWIAAFWGQQAQKEPKPVALQEWLSPKFHTPQGMEQTEHHDLYGNQTAFILFFTQETPFKI